MAEEKSTYHIVGGGLSGLMCAKYIKTYSPCSKVVIYETSSQIGGNLGTFFYSPWMMNLDNVPRMILSSNKIMRCFVHDNEWRKNVLFASFPDGDFSISLKDNADILLKHLCRGSIDAISPKLKQKLLKFFWGNSKNQPKLYATCGGTNTRIVNLLSPYADAIVCDCELKSVQSLKGRVYGLRFNQGRIKLPIGDKVIMALDNQPAARFLALPLLETTRALSITYYTSQTIFLPHEASFVGINGASADWLTITPNLITAFVYDYCQEFSTYDKLALKVWEEISQIRGVNSGFAPSYKVDIFERAGIKMTDANNALRPDSASSKYNNVFICGDWSMKDYPCCMETAALSAQRAARLALKTKLK